MSHSITIRGETSTQTYIAAYRVRWADNSKFGKIHLVTKIISENEVLMVCGFRCTSGMFIDTFDVYDEELSCSRCRKIALF